MENKSEQLNKILEEFLKSEAETTDSRIVAIRYFLTVLNESVEKYIASKPTSEEAETRIRLSQIIDGMAEIYQEEISNLLLKRGKLQEYIIYVKNKQEEIISRKLLN